MKKVLISLIIIACIGVIGWNAYQSNEKKNVEEPEIKIGVILPLTGASSHMGQAAKAAAELAFEDAMKKGTKHKYKLILEDDGMDTIKTMTRAQRLIFQEDVNALVSFAAGPGKTVKSLAQDNKIIHFGWTTDPTIAEGEYNFIHSTQPDVTADKFVDVFMEKGLNNISFITLNHNGVAPIVSEIVKRLKDKNINIVAQHTFDMGTRDFRILLLKAAQEKPDIYFFCSFAAEMETIRRQMLEAEIKTPMTSVECMDLLKDNSLYEGSWYVGDASEKNPEILRRITQEKKATPTHGTSFLYDIVNLLVWAYENTPVKPGQTVPSNADVIQTIHNKIAEYPSIFGTVSVSKDGIIHTDALVKTIQNGKIVPVDEKEEK